MKTDDAILRSSYPKRTICEVLREIWDLTCDAHSKVNPYKTKEETEKLLLEALTMAKKMNAKLTEYKRDWHNDMGFQPNRDYQQDLVSRANR